MSAVDKDPSLELPNGEGFQTWEAPSASRRTLYVNQRHPGASDDNPGTADRPLRTIQAAADRAEPGDQVLIRAGVYRECVRPPRGGQGDAMIGFEAAPGEEVVIAGSEPVVGPWRPSAGWRRPATVGAAPVWAVRLPREWFVGENPFTIPNRAICSTIGGFDQQKGKRFATYMRRRGMFFQDGRRLEQVNDCAALYERAGRFWPEPNGLVLHVRPFDDAAPETAAFEATARSQCFAPDATELGFIRLKGLCFRHAANGFPFMPQEGAVSANRGHHWIIESCTIEQVNGVGIDLGRRDARMEFPAVRGAHLVRGNTVRHCGVCGIAGLGQAHTLIEDNLVEDCCWHDVEEMFESAGIKTHHNHHTLLRRNLIRRIPYGCGIWLDYANDNSRCTGNLIHDVGSMFGGIFIEASHKPVRVDQNIILGVRAGEAGGGHGIYAHDEDFLRIDHNLIARTQGSGIHLPKGQADRFVEGRGSCSRHHTVVHNLLAGTSRYVSFHDAMNTCDGNLYGAGAEAGPFRLLGPNEWLDLETWQRFHGLDKNSEVASLRLDFDAERLRLRVEGLADASRTPCILPSPLDYCGRTRQAERDLPGPFAGETVAASDWLGVDPRRR